MILQMPGERSSSWVFYYSFENIPEISSEISPEDPSRIFSVIFFWNSFNFCVVGIPLGVTTTFFQKILLRFLQEILLGFPQIEVGSFLWDSIRLSDEDLPRRVLSGIFSCNPCGICPGISPKIPYGIPPGFSLGHFCYFFF